MLMIRFLRPRRMQVPPQPAPCLADIICARTLQNKSFWQQSKRKIRTRIHIPAASRHTCATKKHSVSPITMGSSAETAVHLTLPVSL